MSKEWHDKMHERGIWHGSSCSFCKGKAAGIKARRMTFEEQKTAMKSHPVTGPYAPLREAKDVTKLLAQAAKIVAKSKKEAFLADAERILAKPKPVRRKR